MLQINNDEMISISGGKGSCRCYDKSNVNVISAAVSYGNSCFDFCCKQHPGYRWDLSGSHEPDMSGLCEYGAPGNKSHDSTTAKDIGKKILGKLF